MKDLSTMEPKPGVSKLKLAIGAASLFLFIVGLKRSFSVEEAQDGARTAADPGDAATRHEQAGSARVG